MSEKTPFFTRITRLFKITGWLFHAMSRVRKLENATLEQRNAELAALSAQALTILNARLNSSGTSAETPGGLLIAANHISILDIFAILSLCPCSFIAMQELKRWPLVGRLAANAGTVFIDRGNRKDVNVINEAICLALEAGQNVCFFPESRTSSGSGILPFKAALFQSAIDTGSDIQPVVLRYFDHCGRPSAAPSFSDVNLVVSMWRIVSMPSIEIRIDFLPRMKPQGDRYQVKDRVEEAVGSRVDRFLLTETENR
ncbi:MAG: 1-acylglycerol-3-phosphate O-acyltransferase [Neisseria sp.]|nr:1-acylglycerol-3-phosphate O-acyltransferase [Neisseria sp.]